MAGERDDHDKRIADAIRHLAGDDRRLDTPPPELWGRIAGALDERDRGDVPLMTPPPELWDRIAAEVRAEGGEPELPAPTSEVPHPDRGRGGTSWGRTLLAVAAALLLVVAAAVALTGRTDDPGTEVVARASLTGEGLDPGGASTGTARLVRQGERWEVAIRAADLPAPAPGTYYEAWLLGTGEGQVQSLGILDGEGGFTVPEDLDVEEFPVVDVSIEPLDGDPGHSAQSVLRGRLE